MKNTQLSPNKTSWNKKYSPSRQFTPVKWAQARYGKRAKANTPSLDTSLGQLNNFRRCLQYEFVSGKRFTKCARRVSGLLRLNEHGWPMRLDLLLTSSPIRSERCGSANFQNSTVRTHYPSAHQPSLAARPRTYLLQTGSYDVSIQPRHLSAELGSRTSRSRTRTRRRTWVSRTRTRTLVQRTRTCKLVLEDKDFPRGPPGSR